MKRTLAVTAALVVLALAPVSFGNIAVDVDGSAGGWPVNQSNHGWEFTTSSPITLTHLGLWDDADDGFGEAHQIGLWRLSDSALLTSGTVSAGTGDPLTDHFRYVDVSDAALSVGVSYVVGFHSPQGPDPMILTPTSLTTDPLITITRHLWEDDGVPGFQMPYNNASATRLGPNFMFTTGEVIPAPGAILLGGIGVSVVGYLRRRRLV